MSTLFLSFARRGALLASLAVAPGCGESPSAAAVDDEEARVAARTALEDLEALGPVVERRRSSFEPVHEWSAHLGRTVAVVGRDAAGEIHAAVVFGERTMVCATTSPDEVEDACGRIVAAIAGDLRGGAPPPRADVSTQALRFLESSAVHASTTDCAARIAHLASVFVHPVTGEPTDEGPAKMVICEERARELFAQPGSCMVMFARLGAVVGPDFTGGGGMAASCCEHLRQTKPDNRSPGSILLPGLSDGPVPLLYPR